MRLERGWAGFKNIAIDLLKVKALWLYVDLCGALNFKIWWALIIVSPLHFIAQASGLQTKTSQL